MDAFLVSTTFDGDHLIKQPFGALGFAAAKVAFPTLGAHKFPRSSQAKTLCSGLMSLDFVFLFFLLTRHSSSPFTRNAAESQSADEFKSIQLSGSALVLLLSWCEDHQHAATFYGGGLFDYPNIR